MSNEREEAALRGLTSEEVRQRVADGLVNGDQNIKTKSVAQIIRTNTLTFFNGLFLVFAAVLAFFVDKGPNGKLGIEDFANFGFVGVIIVNMLIGILQELKAKKTIDKLTLLSAPKVTVVRDGQNVDIPLKDIVIDDVMLLSAGRQICADAVVVDGQIEVNESLITGEPDAILKQNDSELLSGSFTVSGYAAAKVVHIGKDNYAAKISSGAKYIKRPNSKILNSLNRFIKLMAIIIVPLGIALFSVKYWAQDNVLNQTVKTVIGTLIGMIPSGLMMLNSAVFCVSVIRLAKRRTLAQDLYCVETLARVDVLCLDKTGTITEGKMEVVGIVAKNDIGDEALKQKLKDVICAVNDDNPTANAAKEYTCDIAVAESAESIAPFSSARKWSGANFEDGAVVFGAAEFIFEELSEEIKSEIAEYSAKGIRVLALAEAKGKIAVNTLPQDMSLLGFVLITDKIRAEAPDTLRYFAEQGVTLKIISGDNPVTVKSIAERAGLNGADMYVDASTLETDEELAEAIEKYTVFGRVTPDQKLKFVKHLKKNGHTVGMTGDGVNDVLALKEADCSIAMASGSDAAKNVSSLVLMDSNFASMPRVVAEGRRSINNLTRSGALYLVKTFYNMFFAIAFMILNADLPFEPKHLTLIGWVTIGIPSYVLALEPNKELVSGKFFNKVVKNALPTSITIVFTIIAIVLAARIYPDISRTQISTMCSIATVVLGLTYIAKISVPFNKVRVILLIAMVGIFVASFFADFSFFSLTEFFGLTSEFSKEMLIILLPTVALSIGLFFLMYFIAGRFNKHDAIDKLLAALKIS